MNTNNYNIIPLEIAPKEIGENLDLKALATFAAFGFFAGQDTYWENIKWDYLDFKNQPWTYEPRSISLDEAVEEFGQLFHSIILEELDGRKPMLALSGGIDSRTLATACKYLNLDPYCFSYSYDRGIDETKYGQEIARIGKWEYDAYSVPQGYIWNNLDKIAKESRLYSDFSHSRQVAFAEELSSKGEVWLLGHWGDVLFDNVNIDPTSGNDEQVEVLLKKVLKKGGVELGQDLWNHWNLKGDFRNYLRTRIKEMLKVIDISDARARIRAFKSLYWATRWTSVNLAHFSAHKDMSLPYYNDKMCKFVMSIPEELLANRVIQIEYIKKFAPELAKVEWQEKSPYNLYDYHKHLTVHHLPNRVVQKAKRVLSNKKLILRNWELQYLGDSNRKQLEDFLFKNENFVKLFSEKLLLKYVEDFYSGDHVKWSHPLSVLLNFSLFMNTSYKSNS